MAAKFNINCLLNGLLPSTSLLAPKVLYLLGLSHSLADAILIGPGCDLLHVTLPLGDARPDRNSLNQACSGPIGWYFKDSSVTYLTFFSLLNNLEIYISVPSV